MRPSCGSCVKKSDTCSFLLLAPSSHLTVTPTTSIASSLGTRSAPSVEDCNAAGSNRHTDEVVCHRDSSYPDGQNPVLRDHSRTNCCILQPSLTLKPQLSGVPLSPYLRFQDPWKDTRSAIPSSLRDLLCHYEHTTSLTIDSGDLATAVWQLSIPQIATDHDFLVHCVLSISSLHIGHLSETKYQHEQTHYWNAVAASQMNHALSGYRFQIDRVTPKNVAAVFASSALTAVYLFRTSVMDFKDLQSAIPSCGADAAEVVGKMMSCVVKTMWGLRGPLEVLMKGWSWLINSSMRPVASREWWPKTREPSSPRAQDEDERLRHIEDLWMETDRQCDPHSNYLGQALDLLRETYALISQLLMLETPKAAHEIDVLLDRGAVFSWVTRVPREYIQLVEAQDRDALVILAHYAVLLTRMDKVWWLEGLGSNFVIAIAMALGSEHWKLIEWPVRVAGVDLAFLIS